MLKFICTWTDKSWNFTPFQNILCWSLSPYLFQILCRKHISKHLMLKFIFQSVNHLVASWYFKTSYVEVYLRRLCNSWRIFRISKHLMLKFIIINQRKSIQRTMISKHLMLKFIPLASYSFLFRPYFKTSYVEVYLFKAFGCWVVWQISKHLMLKFIKTCLAFTITSNLFQNILCWSLSGRADQRGWIYEQFQNILCWSLSAVATSHTSILIGFQNILCWSLSQCAKLMCEMHEHFKTSYVEVYLFRWLYLLVMLWFQNILCWSLSIQAVRRNRHWKISKHLMLKFIKIFEVFKECELLISKHLMLKFIERRWTRRRSGNIISKHLMLKFIRTGSPEIREKMQISKHLMLKFII